MTFGRDMEVPFELIIRPGDGGLSWKKTHKSSFLAEVSLLNFWCGTRQLLPWELLWEVLFWELLWKINFIMYCNRWYLVPPYYYFAVFMAKMQWTFIPAFSILAVSRGSEILHDGKWWKPIKCALYDRKKWTPSYSIQCSALYLIKFSNLVSESLRSSLPLIYLMKNQYANVVSCLLYNVQVQHQFCRNPFKGF